MFDHQCVVLHVAGSPLPPHSVVTRSLDVTVVVELDIRPNLSDEDVALDSVDIACNDGRALLDTGLGTGKLSATTRSSCNDEPAAHEHEMCSKNSAVLRKKLVCKLDEEVNDTSPTSSQGETNALDV